MIVQRRKVQQGCHHQVCDVCGSAAQSLQGACGYGVLKKESYPFWSVAALSLSNSFSVAGPAKACGECFEIKCMDVGGPFAVRRLGAASSVQ